MQAVWTQIRTDRKKSCFLTPAHANKSMKKNLSRQSVKDPSKTSSTRFTHPWISTKTRRLSRRKARAYRKAKNTNNMKDWCNYKSLKTETQREMRRAHQAYIHDTVNQDLTANSKRFYSYVKSKKPQAFHHF